MILSLNREAVATQSPGLPRFGGYPGESKPPRIQSQRDCARLPTTLNGMATGATSSRLKTDARLFPRVAAKARQPWALGRNRFAVNKLHRGFANGK